MLKETTFGSTEAAKILAAMLETNYKTYAAKVSYAIQAFNTKLIALKEISDLRIRRSLLNLIMADAKSKIQNSKFPDELKTFVLNVLARQFRKFIRKFGK